MSGDKTRFFNMSYDHLVKRGMAAYYFINPGPTGVFPALQTGSMVSRLTQWIEKPHHDVALADAERRAVYAWIDSNIQYYPTWDMSRPYTTGGRDPWHFVPDNKRGPQKPEPWFANLTATFDRHCASCHETPKNDWINLSRPEFSRLLNAHLAKAAGGLELTKLKKQKLPPVFKDTNDPVYQSLLQPLAQGAAALQARPRMDMPGAVAIPQARDFGKVF
jgi:hypothetical protein